MAVHETILFFFFFGADISHDQQGRQAMLLIDSRCGVSLPHDYATIVAPST